MLVVLSTFIKYLFHQAHDALGHNSTAISEVNVLLEVIMKNVDIHIKYIMYKVLTRNLCSQHYAHLHLGMLLTPMHFIAMDLIGKFKPLPQGHQYALVLIDVLANYTWCIALYTKEADKEAHVYLVNIYSKFGGLHKILSDNRTQYKNKSFMQVISTLRTKQVFSSS